MTVILYFCDGTFSGASALTFKAPEAGMRHRFLLFLRQDTAGVSYVSALAEAERFGFSSIKVLNGKPLDVETLNGRDGLASNYEEALSEGSSLVWYP